MALFQWGDFQLHSGDKSWWRIDCDALTDSEIELFAKLIKERCGEFHEIRFPQSHPGSCVPKLAAALEKYKRYKHVGVPTFLVIDDVLTTGASMEAIRHGIQDDKYNKGKAPEVWGVVLFARGKYDSSWITPVFAMPE